MTAKEWLSQTREMMEYSIHLINVYDDVRSRAFPGAIRIKPVMVQESCPSDRMAESLCRAGEIMKRIEDKLDALHERREQARIWIADMPNETHRDVIWNYYCCLMDVTTEINGTKATKKRTVTLRVVAEMCGKSESRIRHIHKEAIRSFSRASGLPMR